MLHLSPTSLALCGRGQYSAVDEIYHGNVSDKRELIALQSNIRGKTKYVLLTKVTTRVVKGLETYSLEPR